MSTKRYPSDMTDEQWELIKGLIPPKKGRGRPRTVDLRRVLDGILYILRSGCQYRMLPHDFPPWETVYYYLSKWQDDGTLEVIHDALREQVRAAERPAERTTASMDSQSTDSHGAQEARGVDGGKKLEGRKRHLIVDSLGLLLAVAVTAGNVTDAQGAMTCLGQIDPERYPQLNTFYADRAYEREGLPGVVEAWRPQGGGSCRLVIVSRPDGSSGFVRLPIRWVVERTNAWLTKNRRLCRSYEHTVASEVAYIRLAMISRMMRRLKPTSTQSPFKYRCKLSA
jgi:putative transposase